jgi:putative transposase
MPKAQPPSPKRVAYPSDLTDAQWQLLEPLIPPAKSGGRPRTANLREVLNAICYLSRSGCAWRALPHDFPPWSTVYEYFRAWRIDGTWQSIADALRVQVRIKAGRDPTPSAAIIDSQSAKTTEKGGRAVTTPARK